jgi:hypothetical protein
VAGRPLPAPPGPRRPAGSPCHHLTFLPAPPPPPLPGPPLPGPPYHQGTSAPIAIPNMARWRPGAPDSGAPKEVATTFIPPHQLSRQDDFHFSLVGASPAGALKRDRLRTRNAILRSTGAGASARAAGRLGHASLARLASCQRHQPPLLLRDARGLRMVHAPGHALRLMRTRFVWGAFCGGRSTKRGGCCSAVSWRAAALGRSGSLLTCKRGCLVAGFLEPNAGGAAASANGGAAAGGAGLPPAAPPAPAAVQMPRPAVSQSTLTAALTTIGEM